MFANNNLSVMNFAFPDVCKTPDGAKPLVNIATSCANIPIVLNIILGGGLAENLLTMGANSDGDEAGVGLGVASQTILAPNRPVLGSSKVFFGPAAATRLGSLKSQNSGNTRGFSATPGQFVVLVAS